METLKNILWLILIFFPLLMILVFGIINFIRKERLVEILVKSLIAFILYILTTSIAFIALLIVAFSNKNFGQIENKILILFASLYICFGLFLGWFVKRDLSDSLSIFVSKPEKMPILFN